MKRAAHTMLAVAAMIALAAGCWHSGFDAVVRQQELNDQRAQEALHRCVDARRVLQPNRPGCRALALYIINAANQ